MAFHIVTNRCFLACEKVTSVVIEESDAPREVHSKKHLKLTKALPTKKVSAKKKQASYVVIISYYPLAQTVSSNSGFSNVPTREEYLLEIKVTGKKEAYALYAEIIREVQEQHPGEGYLDKLVNKMLESEEFQPAKLEIDNAI